MRRSALLVLVLLGLSGLSAGAQPATTDDGQGPRAVLNALFDGMRAGDRAAVRSVFHSEAQLHRALGPSDTAAVRATSIDAFVAAVGEPREQAWDERTWDVEVRRDGPLAHAWVPYAFYVGEELSHCGVNAVQFVETADGWRILQITDIRHSDCEVPPDVQK